TIENLYQRIGHDESAQIYKQRLQESEFYQQSIIKPELPWYRSIFERF
ncbi:outer membrane protein assembly factor BamD, partial [Campylobacter jejuni]|nr:outer membrane protein assembly factor BamD [Campylobacter jejuni]